MQVLHYFDIEYIMHWTKKEISKGLESYNVIHSECHSTFGNLQYGYLVFDGIVK